MFILKIILWIVLICLAIVALYIISGLILPLFPVNKKQNEATSDQKISIYLKSDGIHTDFIVPGIHPWYDWTNYLNPKDFESGISQNSWLGFGWGDKGFYLEIPEWSDLTFKIAFNAMVVPSPTCVHVTAFDELPKAKYFYSIEMNFEQYQKLCSYINSFFQRVHNQVIILPGKGYNSNDNFYESNKPYHALNTCNEWINKGLKASDVKTAAWVANAKGLFIHDKKKRKVATPVI